jgi:hypothetical protein
MERQKVASTSIQSVGYGPLDSVLEIEFANGGVYRFYRVPRSVAVGLLGAESKGRFFAERIRGRYTYQRVREVLHAA